MRERTWRESGCDACRKLVADDERRHQIAARARRVFSDGPYSGQNLHRGLPAHKTQSLAELDRPSGDAVEQCRRARILLREAARVYRGAAARRAAEPIAQLLHFRPYGAREYN